MCNFRARILNNMIRLTKQQWKAFNRIRRKHKVSLEFLQFNLPNILKFIAYSVQLRIVLKLRTFRKKHSILLKYNQFTRVNFDEIERKRAKLRKLRQKQWSKRMTQYLRKVIGVKEYDEIVSITEKQHTPQGVTDEMRLQLELLKSGKRSTQLIDNVTAQDSKQATQSTETDSESEFVLNEKTGILRKLTDAVMENEQVSQKSKLVNDVNDEMRLQLQLLKSGKRSTQLIEHIAAKDVVDKIVEENLARIMTAKSSTEYSKSMQLDSESDFVLNEKTGLLEKSIEEGDGVQENQSSELAVEPNCTVNKHARLNEGQNKPTAVLNNAVASNCFADISQDKTDDDFQKLTQPAAVSVNKSASETVGVTKASGNILDILMQKVLAPKINESEKKNEINKKRNSLNVPKTLPPPPTCDNMLETTDGDSSEEFLGFADDERLPGMLRTPLVRCGNEENPAFISRTLDEYFRANDLDTSVDVAQLTKLSINRKVRQTNIEGLMTPNCKPPALAMPALPGALQKMRTVAERRQYLQKSSRSSKLSIIDNEAKIYRELQRKMRQQRIRCPTQLALQTATHSQIAFSRQGWQAASFINTELNKYFFQKLIVKEPNARRVSSANKQHEECYNLRGVLGNNTDKFKPNYSSRLSTKQQSVACGSNCIDCLMADCLKPVRTFASKKKLCNEPYKPLFKPCPLSAKPSQQICDKETALAGEMKVVRLPTIELAVTPELGKTFNDVAMRYLHYIAPYENISRAWAEFSVSTLQTTLHHDAKKCKEPLKTFVFNIPYANDRCKILVRRVLQREEHIDEFFASKSAQLPNWHGLSFHDNVDRADEISLACADVLADMINSVAISCSEDSFTHEDTEQQLVKSKLELNSDVKPNKLKPDTKTASALKTSPVQLKKSRLILELKRLNATIIDTQSLPNSEATPQCCEEFCVLGCICQSLKGGKMLNQHCGKLQCMFDCRCKASNNGSQIVRLKCDGQHITTADAVMMRRQATASLARMEKEFTSTIVVTENETLLINDTACEKKRRAAKIPKRYEDYRQADEEYAKYSPIKSGENVGETRSPSTSATLALAAEREQQRKLQLLEPVLVEDVVLKKLKHCSVPLVPFDQIQNMTVFCMVHQLYKCFCGGHDIEGKRLIIEKENATQQTSHFDEALPTIVRSPNKSRYSFEKSEHSFEDSIKSSDLEQTATPQTPKSHRSESKSSLILKRARPTTSKLQTSQHSNETDYTEDESSLLVAPPPPSKKPAKLKSGVEKLKFNNEQNVLIQAKRYGCSRCAPIPVARYLNRNRKQVEDVLRFVHATEDRTTQLLLNEHIMRSVYFHKEMLKAEKAKQLELQISKTLKRRQMSLSCAVPLPLAKQPKLEIEYPPEAEESATHIDNPTATLTPAPQPISPAESLQTSPQSPSATLISKRYTLEVTTPPAAESVAVESKQNAINFNVATTAPEAEAEAEAEINNADVRDNYNEVIKTLNSLVSRKMHDIDNALKRDSKVVPTPTEDILCVLRWRNFAEAYRDNFIYVWEVKMKSRHFLAATIKNIIPIVPGALGVMNIMAVPSERLPLIGRMLMGEYTYDEMLGNNLAVIMQGRSQYWYIKGFLQPDGAKSCLRPTPGTHPELTLKINTLCSSLIKQRARELDRQAMLQKQRLKKQQQKQEQLKLQQEIKLRQQQQHQREKQQCIRSSNVAVRRVTKADIADIRLPTVMPYDHRWFVLDWAEDFTHIFLPELKELITHEHIKRMAETATLKNKIHRMEFYDQNHFAAYFLPGSNRKMYFGPIANDQQPPKLVLMQKVQGEMVPREMYERQRALEENNFKAVSTKATTGFWVTQKNGKLIFDEAINMASTAAALKQQNETKSTAVAKDDGNGEDEVEDERNADNDDGDDDVDEKNEADDDCVVVIENKQEQPTETVKSTPNNLVTASTKPRMSFTIKTSETNTLEISATDGFQAANPQHDTAAEAKAKILSVFKLPAMSITETTAPTSQPVVAATNDADNQISKMKTYQHEFTKLISEQPQNASTKNAPVATKIKVLQPFKSNLVKIAPKTQEVSGGGYKLCVAQTSTDIHGINNKSANVNANAVVAVTAATPTSDTANKKITNIAPMNVVKAIPLGKVIRAIPTKNAQSSHALTTVRRIQETPNLQTPTTTTPPQTANMRPIKRLSSGLIRIPAKVIKSVQPIVATKQQQQQKPPLASAAAVAAAHNIPRVLPTITNTTNNTTASANFPNSMRIAQTIVTQIPTSAHPVNVVAAQQQQQHKQEQQQIQGQQQKQQQLLQSTTAAIASSSSSSTTKSNPQILTTKPIATKAGQTLMQKSQMTTALPTIKRQFQSSKIMPASFLAKKTAGLGVFKTSQSIQAKKLFSSNSHQRVIGYTNLANRDDLTEKLQTTNQQRHSLPNPITRQPPAAKTVASAFLLHSSDVILIDD